MSYHKHIKKAKEIREEIDEILNDLPPQTEVCEEVDIALAFLSKSRKNMFGAIKKMKEAETREDWK